MFKFIFILGKRAIGINDEDNVDSSLGLGELAQLTVNNDAESTYDIASSKVRIPMNILKIKLLKLI